MDIFATAILNGVVDSLIRPQASLLDMFFPIIVNSDAEEIKFDIEEVKRRITPFVHPTMQGKMVESQGHKTATFVPAYAKDKRVFDPKKPLKRKIGEKIGGDMSPIDRAQANLAYELNDQTGMLIRRQEVMASEVMRTGMVTVTGDGYPTVVVDFGRNANHTVTLTGANRWGQAGIVPLDDIENWSLTMLQNSGAVVTDVVMDTLAWRLFIAEAKTEKVLDIRRGAPDSLELVAMAKLGLQWKGSVGNVGYWVYSDWYVNDAGTEVPMIPDYTVILGTRDMEGVRHFGAIRDEEAGFQAREYFAKSWVKPDPSVRYLLLQSAPLICPYRPDASFCATVN